MTYKVDISKLREGDVVLVRGTIEHPNIKFKADDGNGYLILERGYDIVSVKPCPLKVGDQVEWPISHLGPFQIRAIDDDVALIRSNGDFWAVLLSELIPA